MQSSLKQIDTTSAINIFGEIAAITESERTANLRVTSEAAIVYKFLATDLRKFYTNPTW